MKELLQSIFASAKDRINNVFAGTFAIAWIICNWEPISIFLFWDWDIVEKWCHLNLFYNNWVNLLLWPLIATAVYLLIIPFANWGLAHVQTFFYVKIKNQVNTRNTKTYDTEKELVISRVHLELAEAKERKISDHKKEVEELNKIIQNDNEIIKQLREDYSKLNNSFVAQMDELKKSHDQYVNGLKSNYSLEFHELKEQNNNLESKLKTADDKYRDLQLNIELQKLAENYNLHINDIFHLQNQLLKFIDRTNDGFVNSSSLFEDFISFGESEGWSYPKDLIRQLIILIRKYHI